MIAFGRIHIIEDEQEKLKMARMLGNRYNPNDDESLQKELETLRAERNVANHKSQLLSIGFEDTLAQEVAEAINAGETAKVFDGLRKFIVAHDKALKENALRNNPTLPGGDSTAKVFTKEQFDAMGYKEREEVFEKYPDLYKEYTK